MTSVSATTEEAEPERSPLPLVAGMSYEVLFSRAQFPSQLNEKTSESQSSALPDLRVYSPFLSTPINSSNEEPCTSAPEQKEEEAAIREI